MNLSSLTVSTFQINELHGIRVANGLKILWGARVACIGETWRCQ